MTSPSGLNISKHPKRQQVNKATASDEQIQQLLRGVPIDSGVPARALSARVLGHELVVRKDGGVAEKLQIQVPGSRDFSSSLEMQLIRLVEFDRDLF